jgi:hypothetical protein
VEENLPVPLTRVTNQGRIDRRQQDTFFEEGRVSEWVEG